MDPWSRPGGPGPFSFICCFLLVLGRVHQMYMACYLNTCAIPLLNWRHTSRGSKQTYAFQRQFPASEFLRSSLGGAPWEVPVFPEGHHTEANTMKSREEMNVAIFSSVFLNTLGTSVKYMMLWTFTIFLKQIFMLGSNNLLSCKLFCVLSPRCWVSTGFDWGRLYFFSMGPDFGFVLITQSCVSNCWAVLTQCQALSLLLILPLQQETRGAQKLIGDRARTADPT